MTFRSAAQIVGGIIAAIILGAIGSGVWERFLAPASDATYRVLVGLISTVSLSYKDSIYEAAARGFNESYSLQLFSIFCLLLSLASLTALLTIHRSYGRLTRSLIDRYPRLLRIGVPVVVLTFAFFISLTVNRHDAIHETATFAVRSTDILRPFVGEKRYVSLLSSYYQIHTAQDFYAFHDLLQQEAKANKVRLPDFKPL